MADDEQRSDPSNRDDAQAIAGKTTEPSATAGTQGGGTGSNSSRPVRASVRWWPWVVTGAVLLAVVGLLYLLRGVFVPVAIAMFLAYLLDPLVDRIERWRCPRSMAIGVLLTAFFVGFALFALVSVPLVVAEVRTFWAELPQKVEGLSELVTTTLVGLGFDHAPTSVSDFLAQLEATGADVKSWTQFAAKPLTQVVPQLIGGTASVVQTVVALLLIPVLAFYLLYDFDRIVAGAKDLVPQRDREWVVALAREVDQVLSQFVRGQLTVMLILAVLYAVGYWLIGVRMALLIGVVAGLVSFVPYAGSAAALLLALLMVALDSQSWVQALWVIGVYAVIQLFEGFYVTPKVVGDTVGLSAIWVLLALMVGGDLFGFLGVLLALPVAAVLKVFVAHALMRYRASEWYLGPGQSNARDPSSPKQTS